MGTTRSRHALHVLVLICALLSAGHADEWDLPPSEVWSESRRFVLKLDHGKQPTLALHEKASRGLKQRWAVPYPETEAKCGWAAPVAAYIADDGRYVVLRDVWGEVGYGRVLIFLGPQGEVLHSYRLEDLITQDEIHSAKLSVSSLWWSENGLFFFRPSRPEFALVTQRGTIRAFDLTTGSVLPLPPARKRKIREEAITRSRRDLSSKDAEDRERGAVIVGVLGDRASVLALKALLRDPASQGSQSTGTGASYPYYDVQIAAGGALVKLLEKDAAPLLEERLRGANYEMALDWLRLMGETRAARTSSEVKRRTRDRDGTMRLVAVDAMLEGDDGTVIHRSLHWLKDPDDRVRHAAINALGRHPRPKDASLLREALKDRDGLCVLLALRVLVKLDPPDLDALLRQSRQSKDPSVAFEATLHLAERGDTAALKRVVSCVQAFQKDIPRGAGWGLFDAERLCRVLSQRKPPGTEAALRAASTNTDPHVQASVNGALATLGDREALLRLRDLARTGDFVLRALAIRWLGTCQDRVSLAFLRERRNDPEPLIRDAAQEALAQFEAPKR